MAQELESVSWDVLSNIQIQHQTLQKYRVSPQTFFPTTPFQKGVMKIKMKNKNAIPEERPPRSKPLLCENHQKSVKSA